MLMAREEEGVFCVYNTVVCVCVCHCAHMDFQYWTYSNKDIRAFSVIGCCYNVIGSSSSSQPCLSPFSALLPPSLYHWAPGHRNVFVGIHVPYSAHRHHRKGRGRKHKHKDKAGNGDHTPPEQSLPGECLQCTISPSRIMFHGVAFEPIKLDPIHTIHTPALH